MMNTSSNPTTEFYPVLVDALTYRDVGDSQDDSPDARSPVPMESPEKPDRVPDQDIEVMVNIARAEAIAETEMRLMSEYNAKAQAESEKITQAITLFERDREDYFARVESDVVHLALAIAAKILHREAQVDTMLVAGLVRFAIGKMHESSSVSIRVRTTEVEKWKTYLANLPSNSTAQVLGDDHIALADCILETDMGSANFSIDAQLKEIEQGFFDLLAQRPAIR